MANKIQIKVEGVDDIIRQIEGLAHGKNAAERAALRGGGVPINKAAKRMAGKAKDTGLLTKSIGLNVKKVKGQLTARIGPRAGFRATVRRSRKDRFGKTFHRMEVANPLHYAHLVEFGTSHSSAQPFIRPAIEQTKDQVVAAMAASLEKHLMRKAARASA
jgi:HK97 gp10 family phage protein